MLGIVCGNCQSCFAAETTSTGATEYNQRVHLARTRRLKRDYQCAWKYLRCRQTQIQRLESTVQGGDEKDAVPVALPIDPSRGSVAR